MVKLYWRGGVLRVTRTCHTAFSLAEHSPYCPLIGLWRPLSQPWGWWVFPSLLMELISDDCGLIGNHWDWRPPVLASHWPLRSQYWLLIGRDILPSLPGACSDRTPSTLMSDTRQQKYNTYPPSWFLKTQNEAGELWILVYAHKLDIAVTATFFDQSLSQLHNITTFSFT